MRVDIAAGGTSDKYEQALELAWDGLVYEARMYYDLEDGESGDFVFTDVSQTVQITDNTKYFIDREYTITLKARVEIIK